MTLPQTERSIESDWQIISVSNVRSENEIEFSHSYQSFNFPPPKDIQNRNVSYI